MASCIRCCRCQSVALPSSAEYWHMGATTMRLGSAMGPSASGEKRWDTGGPCKWRVDGGRSVAVLTCSLLLKMTDAEAAHDLVNLRRRADDLGIKKLARRVA